MGKHNFKIGLVLLFLLFVSKINFAQLGTGWSQNIPEVKVHLADSNESLKTYEKASFVSRGDGIGLFADYTNNEETKTETFRLFGDRSNRSEIRIHDNYGKESRQLEGYVTFFSPIYDQSLIQIWGSNAGATQMMLRGKPQSSGSLALNQEYRSGTPVLMTNCYNKEVKATSLPKNRINLNWTDNSDNENLFRIEQSQDGVAYTPIATVTTNINFYQVSGLSSEANYYFRVKAENAAGNSEYSNIDTVSTSNINAEIIRFNDREIGTDINQFEYVGAFWNVILNQADNFKNDFTENKIGGEYLIFRFTGKQIWLYGQKNSFSGIAAISIDDGPEMDGDFFSLNETKIYMVKMVSRNAVSTCKIVVP